MSNWLRGVARAPWFARFITIVIVFAGVLVGLETYPEVVERHGPILHALNALVLWIFVAEVVVKMGAEWPRPWRYFGDGWNVFDFLIVAVCFLPVDANYVMVLRLARLLRVLKLVHSLPRLQVLVGALLRSIPSMGFVALLLFLLFYVYGVAATFLFGANDPVHFGTLQISLLSLFRVVTLEDWTDLMYIQMYGCEGYGYGGMESLCTASNPSPVLGALFFVSFVLVGTMIILNLFIGVIMNGMEQAQEDREEDDRTRRRGPQATSLEDEIFALTQQLETMQKQVARISKRVVAGADITSLQTEPAPSDAPSAASSRVSS